ncbi:MAG TPA: hypothetical protein VI702_05035 [Nitrospiria bacterium]
MKPCCEKTILRYLKKHRDVAVCDGCRALLLAYGVPRDAEEARRELTEKGVPFERHAHGPLQVIIKERTEK